LLNLSFAVRVSEPLTPIFVPPVEMPAPCHIASGNMTKARRMPKWRLTDAKTGRTELRAVAVIALHHFMSWIALGKRSILANMKFGQASLELQSENPAHLFMNARQEVVRAKSANAFNARISW
jgi:hypothetical protein